MAKDAKGHGSEARSGHEHAIAVDTVKNPLKGLFLGGPSADQAERSLRNRFGYNDAEIGKLKGGGDPRYEDIVARNPSLGKSQIGGGQPVESNAHAAATLAGGPKSAPVDTHPAMSAAEEAQNRSGIAWGRDQARFHDPASPEYVGKNKRF
jgi:hypothetical protein